MGFALRINRAAAPAKSKTVELHNPYLAARREWDERYGEFITRARNWRTMAVISALVALVATGGMLWQSARSRVIPFVVLVDSLGRPIASGLAERCTVQLAYAIGVAEPVSLLVDTHGTARVSDAALEAAVPKVFPLTPRAMIDALELLRPIYRSTAVYGHFGREEAGFTWERTDRIDALRRALGQ